MIPSVYRLSALWLVVASAMLFTGCVSLGSSPSGSTASDVIGTWTYRASGAQPLSRGTLQITARDGRLMGQLRDAELGTIPLQADVSGRRLELRMDLFRAGPLSVAGSVEGDEFRGLIDRPMYNVTMSADEAAAHDDTVYGSFTAERQAAPMGPRLVLNCPKLGPDGLVACR